MAIPPRKPPHGATKPIPHIQAVVAAVSAAESQAGEVPVRHTSPDLAGRRPMLRDSDIPSGRPTGSELQVREVSDELPSKINRESGKMAARCKRHVAKGRVRRPQ